MDDSVRSCGKKTCLFCGRSFPMRTVRENWALAVQTGSCGVVAGSKSR